MLQGGEDTQEVPVLNVDDCKVLQRLCNMLQSGEDTGEDTQDVPVLNVHDCVTCYRDCVTCYRLVRTPRRCLC